MKKIKIGGVYNHYKNKKYKVLEIAIHSETLEQMVVYEALYDNPKGKIWVRPLKMFFEEVEVNGRKVSRFELLDS